MAIGAEYDTGTVPPDTGIDFPHGPNREGLGYRRLGLQATWAAIRGMEAGLAV